MKGGKEEEEERERYSVENFVFSFSSLPRSLDLQQRVLMELFSPSLCCDRGGPFLVVVIPFMSPRSTEKRGGEGDIAAAAAAQLHFPHNL